jgi:CDP-glycerol glycerophosphotransferase (TagB/SpsB family)
MKTIFICLDFGLPLAYFFETDLVQILLERGTRLVILVPDEMVEFTRQKYQGGNVFVENILDRQVEEYRHAHLSRLQTVLEYARRASADRSIPLTYVDTHRQRKELYAPSWQKFLYRCLRPLLWLLRSSRRARKAFIDALHKYFTTDLYGELFDRYQPDLIVSNTAGWREDQFLLREAIRRGIRTATVIVGWDNPSSQGLPGAHVEYVNVWSEIHKQELVKGVDWPAEKIHVGGMPLYDSYLSGRWQMSRDEYFKLHKLDPNKKLVAFAATALSISPNIHLIELLAKTVGELKEPAQLLVRLHPNHFKSQKHYREEAKAIYAVASRTPDMHIVEPAEVPGGLERYSGEDFPEKASMLAHCDVLVTVYSTMVVEAALHDKPFVSACIDAPGGWKGEFSVPLHEVPTWPTADRVNKQKAGKLALTPGELRAALDSCLTDPARNQAERRAFVESEITYMDGSATRHTADFLWSLAEGKKE